MDVTQARDLLLHEVKAWSEDPKLSEEKLLQKTVHRLHEVVGYYHWVGIYLLKGDALLLGPYAGNPTHHTRIPVGVGVCGTAVAQGANQIVADVRNLANYLACSVETRSEIVVLIRREGKVLGQIDIDSDHPQAFDTEDEIFLEQIAALLAPFLPG